MANEAVLVMELDKPIPFTVADTLTGAVKGTVMKLSGTSMTAAPSTGAVDQVAGILFGDKIASNGQTKAGIYRRGIFRMYCSGSATYGDVCVTDAAGNNYVKSGKALTQFQISQCRILGHFLEDATDNTAKLVYVDVQAVNGA